jgi:hypothetical protein
MGAKQVDLGEMVEEEHVQDMGYRVECGLREWLSGTPTLKLMRQRQYGALSVRRSSVASISTSKGALVKMWGRALPIMFQDLAENDV